MKSSALSVLAAFSSCTAAPTAAVVARKPGTHMQRSSDPVSTLYEFPWDTYLENLAVRPNGQILVNPLTLPQLYLVEPRLPGEIFVVHEFPGVLGLSGIVEYQPDVFAVVTGNYSLSTGDPGAGTWAIWSIDLGGVNITSNDTMISNPPQVRKIADIPEATSLNGLTVVSSAEEQLLLVGDVKAGTIYSLHPGTGDYAVAINNTYTAAAAVYGFGTAATDGMKVRDEVLYFDNAGQGTLVRVPLNVADGTPAGDFEIIANKLTSYDQWDDFTFDCGGDIFIATGGADTVQRIDHRGHVEIIAGNLNSTAISEPTSTKFGRREDDADVLYVTTGGGAAIPVDGDIIIGGQVLAIKTGTKGSFC